MAISVSRRHRNSAALRQPHGGTVSAQIQVLILEDNALDAELMVEALRRADFNLRFERVENEADFSACLSPLPDLIIADYALPHFDGLRALRLVRSRGLDVPFILISGTFGEEIAVEAMRAGADDYLLKERVQRLADAVSRALEKRRLRGEKEQAEAAARLSEDRFRKLAESIDDVFFLIDRVPGRFLYVSPAYERIFGRPRALLYTRPGSWIEGIHPDDRQGAQARFKKDIELGTFEQDYRIVRGDGTVRWIRAHGKLVRDEHGEPGHVAGLAQDVTLSVQMREVLREREAGLRRAQSVAKLAHVITGPGGVFESWSETLPQIAGLSDAQMPANARGWLPLIHPDDRDGYKEGLKRAAREGSRTDITYRLQRPDGEVVIVRQVIDPLDPPLDGTRASRWFSTLQDISEQRRAEERVARLNRVYAVLSGINSLIVRAKSRGELFEHACRIVVEQGQFPLAWIIETGADGETRAAASASKRDDAASFIEEVLASLRSNRPRHAAAERTVMNEAQLLVSNDIDADPHLHIKAPALERGLRSLVVLPLSVGGRVSAVLVLYAEQTGFFDDEEVKLLSELAGDLSFALDHLEKAERLDYLAYYDELSGLPNRHLFMERLEEKIIAARSAKRSLAVFALNIDRFKSINEAFGRLAGDALLREVARRFQEVERGSTRLARMVADTFAIVSSEVESEQQAARLTERNLRACFAPPFRAGNQELQLSAKVGIAMFPNDGDSAETLFQNAEAALKKAKAGGERYIFFTPRLTERIAEGLELESKLRRAVANAEFVLHYQPKVGIGTRSIVGLEALIRWQSPDLGLVPPQRFIGLLEQTGLILEVGSWALRQASLDHRRWVEQGLIVPRVAVNVSAIQLRQQNFIGVVEDAIMDGLAPTAIDLEITESLVMEDIQASIRQLNSVRGLGVNIAIDDFGTGYSSLAYLARLPVQSLKIDRSFVMSMKEDPNAATLVAGIISLAHSLRLKVVAEGVETEAQAKTLGELGCDEMQGYLFSKPVPAEALAALLPRRQPAG